MGYYNPVYVYGVEAFLRDAKAAGVDGLIIVDLPPEEDTELCLPALAAGLNFIRLATPTTDDARLPAVLAHTSGFVYYVSITGITGAAAPDTAKVAAAVRRIKAHTALPVAVGFGVKNAGSAAAIAAHADGVVVGSAIVEALRASLDRHGKATGKSVEAVAGLVDRNRQGRAVSSLLWAEVLHRSPQQTSWQKHWIADELDLQCRPAEGQVSAAPRDPGKPVGQMPGKWRTRLSQGSRSQSLRRAGLRLSHAPRPKGADSTIFSTMRSMKRLRPRKCRWTR